MQSQSIEFYSYFRENGYGVKNHEMYAENTDNLTNIKTSSQGNTNSSICGAAFLNLPFGTLNTLEFTPTCPNTATDYADGLSSSDLVRIRKHFLGIDPFVPLIGATKAQKLEGGWKILAADANNDQVVDAADNAVIGDVILGLTSDFGPGGRNSWEWGQISYYSQFPTSWANNPWDFVLSGIGASSTLIGLTDFHTISFSGTYAQINTLANTEYASTKVGDIQGYGSYGAGNSYICSTSPYNFQDDNAENRSTTQHQEIGKDDIVEVEIELNSFDNLIAVQLPIYIDHEYFEFQGLNHSFDDGYVRYHYNQKTNKLMVLIHNHNFDEFDINDKNTLSFKLKAKSQMLSIDKKLDWHSNNPVEFIEENGDLVDGEAIINIKNIYKSEKSIYFANDELIVNVDEQTIADLYIYSIEGKLLYSTKRKDFVQGINVLNIPNLNSSIYLITWIENNKKSTSKIFK